MRSSPGGPRGTWGSWGGRCGGGGGSEIPRSARREWEALPPGGVRFRVVAGDGVVAIEASYGKVHREFSFRVFGAAAHGEARSPPDAGDRLRAAYRSDLPPGGRHRGGGGGEV